MSDSLTLKWGTLKAWNIGSEPALVALGRYFDAGNVSLSATAQRDTPEQKQAICDLIDAVDCETIYNDWSGEEMTKEAAKKYVMEYGS